MLKLQTENAPRDVYFEIFLRLSIRCLARLRCVSKFINGIISDPLFQKLHFERSVPEAYPLIFTYRTWHENIISMNEMHLQNQKLQVRSKSMGHLITSGHHELVGTCNGLLCFTPCRPEEPLLICNPITRKHISLGESAFTPLPSCTATFGFGFHPSTKEYKIVRIFYPAVFPENHDDNLDFHITAEVYTLWTTDSWRKVKSFPYAPQNCQVYVEGAIYWKIQVGHRLHPEADHIMAFDISTEEFSTIPHPSIEGELSIVELHGSLSVVSLSPRRMTVWILKDRLTNNWDMEYCIRVTAPRGLDRKFPRLICMWESDGVLITWFQDRLFVCKQLTGRLQDIWVSGFPTWLDWDISTAYRATLFPLKPHSDEQTRDNLPRYISDTEFYSEANVHQVSAWEPSGRRDRIVQCFARNAMLHD